MHSLTPYFQDATNSGQLILLTPHVRELLMHISKKLVLGVLTLILHSGLAQGGISLSTRIGWGISNSFSLPNHPSINDELRNLVVHSAENTTEEKFVEKLDQYYHDNSEKFNYREILYLVEHLKDVSGNKAINLIDTIVEDFAERLIGLYESTGSNLYKSHLEARTDKLFKSFKLISEEAKKRLGVEKETLIDRSAVAHWLSLKQFRRFKQANDAKKAKY